MPGTTGWGPTFGHLPTRLWNPRARAAESSLGVQSNRFGFMIVGTADIPVVVEACTNLADPVWMSLQSGSLTNGAWYFSDPAWANCAARFYRLRSP